MAILNGTLGPDNLSGTNSADTIRGFEGNDQLLGFGGNDSLDGGPDNDFLDGGSGQDTLLGGEGDDSLAGGPGDDIVNGGAGYDAAYYDLAPSAVNVSLATGLASGGDGADTLIGIEAVVGSTFDDTLTGDDGPNQLLGNFGNDILDGGSGDDLLLGGVGNDTLLGGAGFDGAGYAGTRADYTIALQGDGLSISRGDEGSDVVTGVEYLLFSGGAFMVVTQGIGHATAEVLGTIFGAAALTDSTLVGQYLALFEQGLTLQETTQAALSSAHFAQLAGSHSNTDFVSFVYQNVVGVMPTAEVRDQLVALLANGTYTQASLGALAAELHGTSGTDVAVTTQVVSVIAGTEGNDPALVGTAVADVMSGRGGNDVLDGKAGSDSIDGGLGIDRALYAGAKSAYLVTHNDLGLAVKDLGNNDTDMLVSVERITYSDISVAYDIAGNAGTAAKIVAGLFGTGALGDEALVGQYLAMLDAGASEEAVVGAAAASVRFGNEAGGHSNAQFVDRVYFNIAGFHPSQETATQFTSQLDGGTYTQAQLGVLAVETIFNIAHADLTGLAQTGLEYTVA